MSEPVQYEDYYVRLVDLPHGVRGVTALDDSGFANIYINSRLNLKTQLKALHHELIHLSRGDFLSHHYDLHHHCSNY